MPDDITEAAFRADALAFLEANAEPRRDVTLAWGEGSDSVNLLTEKTPEEEQAELVEAKAWKATEYDAGFSFITGPAQYGGRELPGSFARAYDAVKAGFRTPSESPFSIGLGMVAPTILAHATEDVKQRYLKKLWRGDIVACQLFSEPVAGSDLAGLQTRATRDGDEWIVNGQKVWTSGAQFSEIGEIICRTDPDLPKHKGLTGFVVDMHAPGVDVRPLRQMTGGASFNEVFFTDVRIPDDHRLGDVNQGWTVALTTLMNERASIGAGGGGGGGGGLTRILQLARWLGRTDDPVDRQALADLYIHMTVARYTNQRGLERIKSGQLPGPEMSTAKLSLTQNYQRMAAVLSTLLGPRLVADTGEWGTYAWSELVLGVPGMRVAGGTDEVMRNIVGERVLGLPKEPAAN
ncbi:MAG: acyl-CoA dehydrogenase [Acidimicrobiales bacterium]|jgi:alkylation response protein AidB-like acyl-CoA dehydrogenase|nr:acyl-CoA dehydrogenase [Acidimicrobiales bacterium]